MDSTLSPQIFIRKCLFLESHWVQEARVPVVLKDDKPLPASVCPPGLHNEKWTGRRTLTHLSRGSEASIKWQRFPCGGKAWVSVTYTVNLSALSFFFVCF